MSSFTIQIQSLRPDFKPEAIGGLIQFIADWAALGARPQMGFGVIQVVDDSLKPIRLDTQPLYGWITTTAGSQRYPALPSLQNIFLSQIQTKDSSPSFTEQDTFKLKYDLRRLFASNQLLRHFIMGTTKDGLIAAKVKISRSYDNGKLMRVWGWIPEEANLYKNGWNREKIVDAIHQHLKTNYTLQVWREMNSMRDTETPSIDNPQTFLHGLLVLKEDGDAA
jgi:CRISPR-associated protein Cmr1